MPQPTLGFWKLTLAIAAGIWLGCLAVATTAWLARPMLPPSLATRLVPPVAPTPEAPPPRSQEEMFQHYLERQRTV